MVFEFNLGGEYGVGTGWGSLLMGEGKQGGSG